MKKHRLLFQNLFLIALIFAMLINLVSCAIGNEVLVAWVDADGSLVESRTITRGYNPTEHALPIDTEFWHYTEWVVSESGDAIVCTAKRIAKKHIVWEDFDQAVIREIYLTEDEEIPELDPPNGNEKWIFDCWEQRIEKNQTVYLAKRKANVNYFIGNVFQIIVKDRNGDLLCSGSGFVINREGWFITNNHVMENGYSATAYFDIKDSIRGEQYTRLQVIGGVYYNREKDIFIGKLEGYDRIQSFYKAIYFTEEYAIDETSYSVGYPNSSTKLEINSGTILEEYSDIYSKIDGIYYVLSSSYIAPGSSGGILVNENFEVIGITSMGLYSDLNKNHYISGGSIPYFLFKPNLSELKESAIKAIQDIYQNKQ